MSKDKYPSIFSPQMEAIVFIILQIFYATRAVLKIGEYPRIFPSFSWGLGSLSTRVFETRTATGSELFSLLTCPHTTTFTLLSIFSPLEMNSIKIWETIRSKNANCFLPVAVRVSKTRMLKLPIHPRDAFRPIARERKYLMDYN